jgi:hypothetical protein
MAPKEKANEARICPKTGHPISAGKYRWARWVLPLAGLFSLIWFLVRVIPKPSRAAYPCQRMAAPLASGFVVWLLGIVGSSLAYRRARRLLSQSRYVMAAVCASVAVAAVWWSLSIANSDPAGAAVVTTEPPNSPMGVAKGIYPGRVVWVRDPAATSWDGATGAWWDDDNTNQDVVDSMVSKAIRTLTGQPDDKQAWDALFRHFNQTNGFGDVGYQQGERVAIKINLNQDAGGAWGPAVGMPSPHVVYSFLDQLINLVGLPGSAITIYDASRYIGDPIYDKVRNNPDPNFQSVTFVVAPDLARNGRVAAIHDPGQPVYTKGGTAYLPRCVTEAKYLVNLALLRPHTGAGITLCAKNHFGSIRFLSASRHQGWTPEPIHNYGGRSKPMDSYNCLVELSGHRHLAGKTLLYFIDGLYPAVHESGNVIRYVSFGDDWFSGILASQDPVAIDSVGFDFLRNEPRCTEVTGHPENYLHEMALADNPPSGTFYDPEGDGISLASLGVHEHWNNAVEKKYSRNLGIGDGIELVVPSLTSEDGPVQNRTQGMRYDFISHAVEEANDGDEIVAARGVYKESVSFVGKAVTIRSEDPNDPAVVDATVIDGGAQAVAFTVGEDASSVLAGFTVTSATQGIYCRGSSPTIYNCRIVDNAEAGVKLWETDAANPTFANCIIAGNGGAGIEMWSASGGRLTKYNCATVLHCTIVGNAKEGISGGDPIVVNSIVYTNGRGGGIRQIDAHDATVSGCNVEGGCPGADNIDVEPGFATPGFWAYAGDPNQPAAADDMAVIWVPGDYHLRQDSSCVDTGAAEAIFGWLATDIDGDPRIVGGRPDIGCDEFVPAP